MASGGHQPPQKGPRAADLSRLNAREFEEVRRLMSRMVIRYGPTDEERRAEAARPPLAAMPPQMFQQAYASLLQQFGSRDKIDTEKTPGGPGTDTTCNPPIRFPKNLIEIACTGVHDDEDWVYFDRGHASYLARGEQAPNMSDRARNELHKVIRHDAAYTSKLNLSFH